MQNSFVRFIILTFLFTLGINILAQVDSGKYFENTSKVLTYGDWLGETNKHIPTMIKTFYYDADNRLVRILDARYQLGDSETTLEIEYEGQLKPETYTIYEYGKSGLLDYVMQRKYKAVNSYFYGWTEIDTIETYEYNEVNKLFRKTSSYEGEYTYVWSGDTLKEEKNISTQGTWNYTKSFSNFVDGSNDCPQNVLQLGKYQNYIIENEYDDSFRIVKRITYNIKNLNENLDGSSLNYEKGLPYMLETWTYAGEMMSLYMNSYWSKSDEKFIPSQKQVFEYDESEGGVKEQVYNYNQVKDAWYTFGSPKVTISGKFSNRIVVNDLILEDYSELPNSVKLSFKSPDDASEDVAWKVFRNGDFIGLASKDSNRFVFYDNEVPNGNWDYFVMADTVNCPGDKYVSNIVKKNFDTELSPVTEISCVESGQTLVDGNPVYAYKLVWNTPNTPYTILGYQVYINPKDYDKNPAAHNSSLIRDPRYLLWSSNFDKSENTIVVETVYNVGFVKSKPVVIKLNKKGVLSSNHMLNVKKHTVYGDMMGGETSLHPQKVRTYFYDNNNVLVRSLEGGFLLGDDPDTPEVESTDSIIPIKYYLYDYDARGRLVEMKSRSYGVYSGYDKAWNDVFTVEETYTYDENSGNLIEKNIDQKKYVYVWDGERLITEKSYSTTGAHLYDLTYSSFNQLGKPTYAFSVSKHPSITSYNRIYEYEYDEKGNMILKREYKYGENIEKDEDGNIVNADKGILNIEETWLYEGSQLVCYQQNKYSSSKKKMMPYSKRIYSVTAKGVSEESYTYSTTPTTEGWKKSAIRNEENIVEYYKKTAPSELKLIDVDDQVNTVLLSCNLPNKIYVDEPVYEIYRNGTIIGVATPNSDGVIEFVDASVPNGVWDYFIKVRSAYDGIDFYCSNVVVKEFNTELSPVTDIRFPVNGVNEDGSLQLQVVWEAPDTDLTIIGYNIYSDIKDFTKNPSPDNGVQMLGIENRNYTYRWSSLISYDKTICIETVYNIGKIKSEKVPVTISNVPVGIQNVTDDNHLLFDGDKLYVKDGNIFVRVYNLNGVELVRSNNNPVIDISNLPSGVYVVKTGDGSNVKSVKIMR